MIKRVFKKALRKLKKLFPKLFVQYQYLRAEVITQYKQLPEKYRKSNLVGYMFNYFIFGCSVDEYNCLFFENRNVKSKREFVTMRKNRKLDKMFNSDEANKILWNKNLFNEYFSQFNQRVSLMIEPDTTDEAINSFIKKCEGKDVILKPTYMYYGIGVHKAESLDEIKQLRDEGKRYVAEEMISNCKELAKLNESSLNTLRCVTCLDAKAEVHFIAIALRLGSRGAIMDNFYGGGIGYHVDVETGFVDRKGMDVLGNDNYLRHPSSGVVMPGFQIPRFEEMKEYVKRVAKHLPDARYVGWDIAVTPDSFEVIEGNVSPSAELSQCDQKGVLKRILSYR